MNQRKKILSYYVDVKKKIATNSLKSSNREFIDLGVTMSGFQKGGIPLPV